MRLALILATVGGTALADPVDILTQCQEPCFLADTNEVRQLLDMNLLFDLSDGMGGSLGWLVVATIGPCPTEDSDNCFWNADTMGNGFGDSFINLRRDDE